MPTDAARRYDFRIGAGSITIKWQHSSGKQAAESTLASLSKAPSASTLGQQGDAGEVAGEVRLLRVMSGEMTRQRLQEALGLKHEDHFREAYLTPALWAGLIEMMIPDKPRSSKQRYRLTPAGHEFLKQAKESQ